jgi:hypothetical protein
MRQAGKERGKMEETGAGIRTPKFAEQVDTLRKRAAFICEDYDFKDGEKFDAALEVLAAVTVKPGTTVQDALDILEEARTILLRYQLIS